MNRGKLNWVWMWGTMAVLASCSSDKSSESGDVANQDIGNAVEITTYPLFAVDNNNAGYGNILEISSDNPTDKFYFEKEHNTEWYYFKATETGRLAFTIQPNDSTQDFNWILFAKTDGEFAREVVEKKVMPLRSNLSKNSAEASSTGLSCEASEDYEGSDGTSPFSRAVEVVKDSTYYLVIDHAEAGGKGYSIRFAYCGSGDGGSGASTGTAPADTVAAAVAEVLPPPPTLPSKPAPVAKPRPHKVRQQNVRRLGGDEEYYIVQPKNTVYSISTSHGMKVMELMRLNRLTNNNIFIGQKLIVRKYNGQSLPDEVAVTESPKPAPAPTPVPEPARTPAQPEVTPVTPAEPTPAPAPASNPAAQPAETTSEGEAPANARTAKPVSSSPAAPTSVEAKNAVSESVQKLWVYVNVVNAKNNNPVNTIVQVVDGKNTKRVDRVSSNQLAYVPIYNDGNRKKIFILDAFSFRKETFELDLDNVLNDSSANQVALVNDTIVLNFELERYKKKDIFAAYNIFFYDDASVMLPKSKYELESLMEMLKENPRTRIRIHGHTNSNSLGKIISLEPGDHDFFRLTAKNKEGFGTAQLLSKRRAESIKYYLVYNGVKDPRLEIKGWGGKKMIYERDATMAHKNKRVEIEILDE